MSRRVIPFWKDIVESWSSLRHFQRLPRDLRRFVFYAESRADWAFLGPVASALQKREHAVVRLTSDPQDPVLECADAFYIGMGTARTVLFRMLEADVFVMTLSDLNTYHLKRSAHPVHYVYIFHSIASTHRVYREHAFDHYDTICCVGPHHIEEIRRTEQVYGLAPKELIRHGYGRLDTLIRDLGQRDGAVVQEKSTPHILVAPTWGPSSLVEHGLEELLADLLRYGYQVTIRFHPMTHRHHPDLAERVSANLQGIGSLQIDPHVDTTQALLDADVMISEWSGAPLEYAFARLRPVLFIDTAHKINNQAFERIELPCLEEDIRERIGCVVPPGNWSDVCAKIDELLREEELWKDRIRAVRDETVFNIGSSGEVGADAILEALEKKG